MTTLISGCGMKPSKVVHVTCAKYHLKIFGHSKVNVGGGGVDILWDTRFTL